MGCAEGKAIGEDMTKEELIKQQIQRIEALENEVASLETELATLRSRYEARRSAAASDIKESREKDLYPQERREILMDVLRQARRNIPDGTRRADVVDDALASCAVQGIPAKKEKALKEALTGYQDMDASLRRKLSDLGIDVAEKTNRHGKVRYYGAPRYRGVIPCSGRDGFRGGRNLAADLIKRFF